MVSHDFFKSAHSKLVSCGNQFELIGQKVRHACLHGALPMNARGLSHQMIPEHVLCAVESDNQVCGGTPVVSEWQLCPAQGHAANCWPVYAHANQNSVLGTAGVPCAAL